MDSRELRGLAILARGNQVRRVSSTYYKVRSQNGNGWYDVVKTEEGWVCSCPDHVYRKVKCKHIHAVEFSLTLRSKILEEGSFILECPSPVCGFCSSDKVVKIGFRKNKHGKVQRYRCKNCGRKFSVVEDAFRKMKYRPEIIALALDLYFKGVSFRKIADHVKQFHGLKVSYVTVYYWIRKYIDLMKGYVEQLKPETSGRWHVDETTVKVGGEYLWLWNLMDADTRYLLATKLSRGREVSDAREVFRKAKESSKNLPTEVVTDGLRAYEDAFRKEFYRLKGPRVKHIRLAGLEERPNNNLVERLHGTFKDRTKVMRGMKKMEAAERLMDGYRIYYNFVKPHISLNGRTPVETAGVLKYAGENKWLELIQLAEKRKRNAKIKKQP
ncbi:MAG: IS6 family transposase [Candidatus Caldarchaeales archaeon]